MASFIRLIRTLVAIASMIFIFPVIVKAESIKQYIPPFQIWLDSASDNLTSPGLLYALALVESGKYTKTNEFVPWPFAIGIGKDKSIGQFKHESLYPESFEEAKAVLSGLIAAGHKNLGVGIMQVNLRENGHLVDNPIHLFDPVTNIKAATKVLKGCKNAVNTVEVLSCYSHGRYKSEKGAKYADKVFDYHNRFGATYENRHRPIGTMTVSELAYFYSQQIDPDQRTTSRNTVYIVE